MALEWIDKYSVNIPEIDIQHKKLFEMINNFHQSTVAGNSTKPIATLIAEMKKYALTHFATEERIMEEKGFPRLKNHKQRHKDFADKVQNLEEKLKEGKLILPSEIVKFLNEWIVNHIQFEDKSYSNYFELNKLL